MNIQSLLHKNDLSDEQIQKSCSRVKKNVLASIAKENTMCGSIFSFTYNPTLGFVSCCLGIIASFLISNNNNFNNPEVDEMLFTSNDYTVVSFLTIMER